jgi:hypothetical protein
LPLKIHCSRLGLNPRTFGPMVSILTTRPPKKLVWTVLRLVVPSTLIEVSQHFRGAYCLHP